MERAGGDDADQPVDVLAQRLAKLEQPGAFLRLGVNFTRDTGAEDRQLFLKLLNVLGQSVFRGIRDQQQQRAKQPGHPVPAFDFDNVLSKREIALLLYPARMLIATIRRPNSRGVDRRKPLFVAFAVNQRQKSFGTLLWLTQRERILLTKNRVRDIEFWHAKPIWRPVILLGRAVTG